MKFCARLGSHTAMVLLCLTATVSADPIVAIYDVQVTGRMTVVSNPVFEPFDQEFTLVLRFDSARSSFGYGPAAFSVVPLAGISPPPGLSFSTDNRTVHGRFGDEDEPSDLVAFAVQSEFGHSPQWQYFRNIALGTNLQTVQPPPIFTAETFPAHLVLGTPVNFFYSTSLFELTPTIRIDPGSVTYQGLATVREVQAPEPVPEPGTVALIGSGLVMLARRQRRRSWA
jgi:hypothetical protein